MELFPHQIWHRFANFLALSGQYVLEIFFNLNLLSSELLILQVFARLHLLKLVFVVIFLCLQRIMKALKFLKLAVLLRQLILDASEVKLHLFNLLLQDLLLRLY